MKIQNLNRLNDVLFKAIFTEDTKLTLNFINSLLSREGTPTFQTIDFIDRELDPEEVEGKESRLDIVGKESTTGEKVNLEIQVIKQKYFGKRSLYYWSRLYNDLKRGESYNNLKRTVTINVLDFILFEDKSEEKNWLSCFGVYDKKTKKQLTEDFEMYFIELPKWSIQKDIKDLDDLESWISYFDKKTSIQELEVIAMQKPMVKEAIKRESIFTQDEIRRRAYDLKEKAERDHIGQMTYAIEHGREQMETLCKYLMADGKTNDIPMIMTNKTLREEMLDKYHIK